MTRNIPTKPVDFGALIAESSQFCLNLILADNPNPIACSLAVAATTDLLNLVGYNLTCQLDALNTSRLTAEQLREVRLQVQLTQREIQALIARLHAGMDDRGIRPDSMPLPSKA